MLARKLVYGPLTILVIRASLMGCKFGLAIFIGRYLGLDPLGLYGLAVGATTIVPVVVSMGIVHLLMRDAVTLTSEEVTYTLSQYWRFVAFVYAMVIALYAGLVVIIDLPKLWLLVMIIAFLEHLGNDVFHLLSNLERPLLANVCAFMRGAGWVLIYVPVAIIEPGWRSLPTLFSGWLVGSLMAFMLFVWAVRSWPWRAAFASPFKVSWIIRTTRRSFILFISDLSAISSQYLDRYVVSLFMGVRIAGVYFLYWSVANAANTLVIMAVMQLQRPSLIRAHDVEGIVAHQQLSIHYLRVTMLTTVMATLTIAGGFWTLLPLVRQPSVAAYLPAFWMIMAGVAMRTVSDFSAMALFTARRDHLMTLTNVVAAVALTVLQIMILPYTGLYGLGGTAAMVFAMVTIWRMHKLLLLPEGVKA